MHFLDPVALKKDFDFELRPLRLRVRSQDGKYRGKREVMKEIKKMHGNGPFLAKHM